MQVVSIEIGAPNIVADILTRDEKIPPIIKKYAQAVLIIRF